PALARALEVLAPHGGEVRVDRDRGHTPAPVVSHAILTHNREGRGDLADGVVITPSHNPPGDGGFKYNPPAGGPADTAATGWIQDRANALLEDGLRQVRRVPYRRARSSSTVHAYDYLGGYVDDLPSVIDLELIRGAGVRIGVDPPFRFMTVDWDGKIRMDCSSPYAMARLIALADSFEVAFANDPDADRHGIVTRRAGLLNPNHYLSLAVAQLFAHRPQWPREAAVGKTVVTSSVIDRVAAELRRPLIEVPVGFQWFVDVLLDGTCG